MYSIPPERLRAAWVFVAFTVVFFSAAITTTFVLAAKNGRGSGFGDGYTVPSCHTPGGPYYVKHLRVWEQQCPNGVTSQLKNKDQTVPGNPKRR